MTEVGTITFLYHSNKYLHTYSQFITAFTLSCSTFFTKNVINISSYALSHSLAQRRTVAMSDFTLHQVLSVAIARDGTRDLPNSNN